MGKQKTSPKAIDFHFPASFLVLHLKTTKTSAKHGETTRRSLKIPIHQIPPAVGRGHGVDRLPKGAQPNALFDKGGLT